MVQFSTDKPIYAQIIDHMSAGIVTGQYASGSKLPSVRELAMELGVNPNTVQRALADLELRGLVYSERTAGRFVTEDKPLIEQTRAALVKGGVLAFIKSMKQFGCTGEELAQMVRQYFEEADA